MKGLSNLEDFSVKILIAADNSPYSKAALDSLICCPWPKDTEFLVVCVVETYPERTDYWNPHSKDLLEEAESHLVKEHESLAQSFITALKQAFPDCQMDTKVPVGFVVDKILETANDWGVDLIVLGSHGRKGLTRFLLGSVSESVASHARTNVRIVRLKANA